jgi:hypothetical protein
MIARVSLLGVVIVLAVTLAGAAAVTARQERDAARPPIGTASIAGTVFLGGEPRLPARKARVTVTNLAQSTLGQTATTDDNGAFIFSGLPAGRFEIQAVKPGYLRASYGASRPERAGTSVIVQDGQPVAGLTLTMVRGGVITGTVRDQRARPAANLSVRVLKIGYRALTGERTLDAPNAGAVVMTDDRGVYRAYGLPPGGYLVMVDLDSLSMRGMGPLETDIRVMSSADLQRVMQAARAGAPGAAGPSVTPTQAPATRMNYAPVFSPGLTDIGAAATIPLGLGEEQSGVDIAIHLSPTATVRGTVRDPAGPLPSTLSVGLVPAGPYDELLAGAGIRGLSTPMSADGTFKFASVPPGQYTATAQVGRGGRGSPYELQKWAKADITVDGRDLDVSLELKPGVAITGRVVFEGASPPTPADLQKLSFKLQPVGSGGQLLLTSGGQVDAQGHFNFPAVVPNIYQFVHSWAVPAAGDRWILKNSVLNGKDAYESPLAITPDDKLEWTLTFTDTPTTLTGVFQDRGGRAATDYYLLIFAKDRARWTPGSRRIRMMRPATDGSFIAKGLPAGEYYLAALTDLESGEWNDPTLLEQLTKTAATVVLREGETTKQDFRIGG